MTLSEIRERVEGATGPDREIDNALWLAFTPGATRKITHVKHAHSDAEWDIDETREDGKLVTVSPYTASVDAALELIERVLPDVIWDIGCNGPRHAGTKYSGEICFRVPGRKGSGEQFAPTAPLALLRALLAALEAANPKGDL